MHISATRRANAARSAQPGRLGFSGAPLMSRKSSAKTVGPLSMGFPEPLKALPMRSSEMGIFKVSPVNSMWQSLSEKDRWPNEHE